MCRCRSELGVRLLYRMNQLPDKQRVEAKADFEKLWGHPHNLKPEDEEAAKKLVAEWEAEASAANPARAIKESLKR